MSLKFEMNAFPISLLEDRDLRGIIDRRSIRGFGDETYGSHLRKYCPKSVFQLPKTVAIKSEDVIQAKSQSKPIVIHAELATTVGGHWK